MALLSLIDGIAVTHRFLLIPGFFAILVSLFFMYSVRVLPVC